jgi:hypothetical protein
VSAQGRTKGRGEAAQSGRAAHGQGGFVPDAVPLITANRARLFIAARSASQGPLGDGGDGGDGDGGDDGDGDGEETSEGTGGEEGEADGDGDEGSILLRLRTTHTDGERERGSEGGGCATCAG